MTATIEVQLDHVRLSALTWGPKTGPLAVLLHGFPDTAHTWRHLGPVLADRGWQVVAPFTRGYAPSSVPDDRRSDVGALMDDAVGLHAALGGNEEAVLVGHDWGAMTAGALAGHRDSPFRHVVAMAVPPVSALPFHESVRHLPAQARRSWYMAYFQLPAVPERSLDRLVPRLWRDWSPGYAGATDARETLAALPDVAHRRTAVNYYRHLARPIRVPSRYRRWQAALRDLPRTPLLYLHGRDDACLAPRFAEIAAAHLPEHSAVRVVEDAGHFLHLEQPDKVNRLVVDFVSD